MTALLSATCVSCMALESQGWSECAIWRRKDRSLDANPPSHGEGNRGNFSSTGTITAGSNQVAVPNPQVPGGGGPANLTSPWIQGQAIQIVGLSGTSGVANAPAGTRLVARVGDITQDPLILTLDALADVSVIGAVVNGGNQVDPRRNHDFKAGDAIRPPPPSRPMSAATPRSA